GLEPGTNLVGRQWARKVGTLPAVTATPKGGVGEFRAVEALCGGPQAQSMSEDDRGTHDRGSVGAAVGESGGERLVEADLVQGQPGELGEGEVSGTEVVEGQADAEFAEAGDGLTTDLGLGGHGLFTDLQDEA